MSRPSARRQSRGDDNDAACHQLALTRVTYREASRLTELGFAWPFTHNEGYRKIDLGVLAGSRCRDGSDQRRFEQRSGSVFVRITDRSGVCRGEDRHPILSSSQYAQNDNVVVVQHINDQVAFVRVDARRRIELVPQSGERRESRDGLEHP